MTEEEKEQVTPPDMWGTTEEADADADENKAAPDADADADNAKEPVADENTEDDGEKKDAPAEGKLPEGFAKRVARANRQRDKAREKAETLEAELEKLKAEKIEAARQPAPKLEPEPNPADFEDYEAYLEAKKTFDAKPNPEPAPMPKQEKAPAADAPLALTAREEMAKEDVVDYMQDDFPEVLSAVSANKDVVITGRMLTALNEMDHPETLLQAFVDDPTLSIKIARSRSDIAMARAMMKHDKPLVKAEAKPGRKANTSKAPNPITPQEGVTEVRKSEPTSYAEFEKQRRDEIANRNADSGYL